MVMHSNAAAPCGYGGDFGQPSYKRKGKRMGKAIRASALILLLTCTARAGWMGNESPTPPPPQPASVAQEPTTDGDISTTSVESLTQIALDLLAVLPSLY